MAPEILPVPLEKKLVYGPPTDVFAFAIILWEIWACTKPYVEETRKFSMWRKICTGSRLPMHPIFDDEKTEESKKEQEKEPFQGESKSTWWPKDLVNLIRGCWAPKPEDRPTFEEIYTHWRDLRANEKRFLCITEASNPWFVKSPTFDVEVEFNEEKVWKERAISFEGTELVIRGRESKFNRAETRVKFETTIVTVSSVSSSHEIELNLIPKVDLGNQKALTLCPNRTIRFRYGECKQTMERIRHLIIQHIIKHDKSDEVCALPDVRLSLSLSIFNLKINIIPIKLRHLMSMVDL